MAVLQTSDFTRTNVKFGAGGVPVALGADYPDGQLGGQVVVHTGSYEVGVMSAPQGEKAIGLFINDAAGSPFENTPAVASGKSPFVSGTGSVVEVDIYETHESDNATPLAAYAAGDSLYGSANGLVTKEVIGTALGTVYRTPGTAGLLGIRLAC